VLTLAQFEPKRYDDPHLRRFAQERVEIRLDPTLTGAQAIAEIETTGGDRLAARCDHARGSFEHPLTRAQVEDKFRTYAVERLPPARADEVIAAVNGLEHLRSVRELTDMLRQEPQRARGGRAA
jgi:2-methylcitrate dehydratase PrpD